MIKGRPCHHWRSLEKVHVIPVICYMLYELSMNVYLITQRRGFGEKPVLNDSHPSTEKQRLLYL